MQQICTKVHSLLQRVCGISKISRWMRGDFAQNNLCEQLYFIRVIFSVVLRPSSSQHVQVNVARDLVAGFVR